MAGCDEPAAIPYIAPVLLFGEREELAPAVRAIVALLSRVRAEDLIWLDERMRGSWVFGFEYGEEWRQLSPQALALWVGPGEPGTLLLRLSTFHANGFVREEAVRRLSLISDGTELPYLLLRLTDWVPQVQSAARDAVFARLRPEYADHFAGNLILVTRLVRAPRPDLGELLHGITRLLMSTAGVGALVSALNDPARETRRGAFALLISGQPDDLEQRLLAALKAWDPVIRLWAARAAATVMRPEQWFQVLERLIADPAPTVRRDALAAWAAASPQRAAEALRGALLDPSAAVRSQARFHLRQSGGFDFARFYREALSATQPRKLATALSGLAETGLQSDAERCFAFLSHPSTRVRVAAIRGLMKVGGEPYIESVVALIHDAAPAVSRQAGRSLQPFAGGLGAERLLALFERSAQPHTRRSLLRLMAALPKWDSIHCLLRAVPDENEARAAEAQAYVRRWNARYNRSQTVPTGEQLMRLQGALAQAAHLLPAGEAAEIRLAVRSFPVL